MSVGFPVVGIGASAGGLEAFQELLAALPPDTGMAFVLVQHLEPHHASHLTEILSRTTKMPVQEAQEGSHVEPNHVYVIPPNAAMIIDQGTLRLSPRAESAHPHHTIDLFFRSLAEDQGNAAIGVVLSGNSSDGSEGLRAIKCAEGTTLAQDEESARWGGMPHSAKATGVVDFVLPPGQIADELVRISAHPLWEDAEHPERTTAFKEGPENLQRILDLLRFATKVDFGQYKPSTIRRRIARRMILHNVTALKDYIGILERHPTEAGDLYQDLLISVTSFFREPKMFEALAGPLSHALKHRNREFPFRVWVAGCATGEEAYSLAIVVTESIEAAGLSTPVQLFGTDINEIAIDRARAAVYPELIQSEVSQERLRKFFTRIDSGYCISKGIRDNCIFARHNLIRDPPFSQLDLASCRNVLIYLGSNAQKRVLPTLHYSLKPNGILLLGSAETIGSRNDLFEVIDGENKIFSKKISPRHFTMTLPDPEGFDIPAVDRKVKDAAIAPTLADIEIRATRILGDLFAPPGVIVNDSLQILHFYGQTGRYVQAPAGETNLNLLKVADESLLTPLRKGVDTAAHRDAPVYEAGVRLDRNGQSREIGLRVIPFVESGVRNYLILFEDDAPKTPAESSLPGNAGGDRGSLEFQLAQARRELAETRDYLRSIIEQHEVATEELRAANEEVQSSNEELQSTNEEIRTAKEELQSSNEELTTVNDELRNRNEELRASRNDINNILNAVNIPIVMVGMDLRIRQYTPAAERLLNTVPGDLGRLVTEVRYAFDVPNLDLMVRHTIQTLAVQQSRIQTREGRWYSVFVRPYRTLDDRIDGAVVTFLDVDDVTRALERAEEARDYAEGIVETVQHPLLVLNNDLCILRATSAFYRMFQVSEDETRNVPLYRIAQGQWNVPQLRALLDQALTHDVPFRDLDVEYDIPYAGRRIMRLNGRRLVRRDGTPQKVLLAMEDVTERKEAAEIQYRRLFESAKDAIVIVDGESGKVVDINPFFVELSRYSRNDIVGKSFGEIAPFQKAEAGRTLVSASVEKEITRYESVPLHAQDGKNLVVDMIANRYRVKDQILIQVNIRDVTQRRRAEEDLRRSNLDLQQFAFAASHDLQEPLRTVINQIELFQKEYGETLGADADEIIHFITTAAGRMRHMIMDLLSYSQTSRAALTIKPLRVESVLATTLSNLQLAIHGTNARITFDPLPLVCMDETQLLQLLQNLIGNAIKYRGSNPPEIHISAQQAGDEWVFSVRDNGLGIDPRFQDHIFTVFRRLHGKEYPGTGIGLATCKSIVERHGGRIWVESAAGSGSTFFFTVPILPREDADLSDQR